MSRAKKEEMNKGGKVKKYAAGGAAKVRKGMATESGMQITPKRVDKSK